MNKRQSTRKSAKKNNCGSAGKRESQQPKAGSRGVKPAPVAGRGSASTSPRKQSTKSTNVVTQQGQGLKPTTGASSDKQEKKGLFKFRRYKVKEGGKGKKARHPKLIVEQEQKTVGFMGLTEEPKSGHHTNIDLTYNPEKDDKRKAYIRKELRHDTIDNFGEILENYKLSQIDKEKIIKYLKKRKKKK